MTVYNLQNLQFYKFTILQIYNFTNLQFYKFTILLVYLITIFKHRSTTKPMPALVWKIVSLKESCQVGLNTNRNWKRRRPFLLIFLSDKPSRKIARWKHSMTYLPTYIYIYVHKWHRIFFSLFTFLYAAKCSNSPMRNSVLTSLLRYQVLYQDMLFVPGYEVLHSGI
jgi:hypothetical protein